MKLRMRFGLGYRELRVVLYRKADTDTLLVRWVRTEGCRLAAEVEIAPSSPAEVLAPTLPRMRRRGFLYLGRDNG
jgi:hypothetical protein